MGLTTRMSGASRSASPRYQGSPLRIDEEFTDMFMTIGPKPRDFERGLRAGRGLEEQD
jgi:hypothetical protein